MKRKSCRRPGKTQLAPQKKIRLVLVFSSITRKLEDNGITSRNFQEKRTTVKASYYPINIIIHLFESEDAVCEHVRIQKVSYSHTQLKTVFERKPQTKQI